MQLLDFLQQYPGWSLDAGGQLWSVEEYVRQFQQRAEPGDRGPEVIARPSIDLGALTLVAMDSNGSERESIGRLFPSSRRW